jgi:hypothetical protein
MNFDTRSPASTETTATCFWRPFVSQSLIQWHMLGQLEGTYHRYLYLLKTLLLMKLRNLYMSFFSICLPARKFCTCHFSLSACPQETIRKYRNGFDEMCYLKSLHKGLHTSICFRYIKKNTEQIGKRSLAILRGKRRKHHTSKVLIISLTTRFCSDRPSSGHSCGMYKCWWNSYETILLVQIRNSVCSIKLETT